MSENNGNKGGMIVLLIFLLICSGLGIAAFTMSLRGCGKDGFISSIFYADEDEDEDETSYENSPDYRGKYSVGAQVGVA